MEEPQPGERYIHFKGKDRLYEIVGIARDCNNLSKLSVIYKSLYDSEIFPIGTIFSRSLEDFVGFKDVKS